MDDYHGALPADELPDEYAALADAREVMREVIELVEELRVSAKKLGDAIAAAGFPAREWIGPDATLALLGEQFPDISLDAFLTRLAEFANGMGPSWLRGAEAEIALFTDDAQILYGVARPLRVFAQRQRMLPARERGDLPLERALADGRVGTQIDLLTGYLRDLDALAPYIVPLTPSEWNALIPPPPPANPPPALQSPQPPQPPPQALQPGFMPGVAPVSMPMQSQQLQQQWPPAYQQQPAPLVNAPPWENAGAADTPQTYSRLRDFSPPPADPAASPGQSWETVLRVPNGQGMLALLRRHKWMVLGITVLLFSAGTGLLSLAALRTNAFSTPTSHLSATPTTLRFSCAGKGATAKLTLRNPGASSLTWTLKPPAALRVSATHATVAPRASVTVTATSTGHAATHGSLTFSASDGTLTVPYTITCP